MNATAPADFNRLLEALKAAGEPTRLRLLRLLAREELSVMELVSILGQSQPRISRHLKLMSDADLVERFPDGAWVFYRLSQAQGVRPLLDVILGLMDDSYGEDLRQLDAVRRARRQSAEAYFETIAPRWDEIRSHYVGEAPVEAAVARIAAQQPYDTLVDLGTGSGRMLTLLAGQARAAIGLDLSQQMLNIARGKAHDVALNHVEFRHGDIHDTRLESGCADLVVIHHVLHFLSDPARAVAEAGRITRVGGRLLIVDFAHHDLEIMREKYQHRRLGFTEEDMRHIIVAAGFDPGGSVTWMTSDEPGGLTVGLWCFPRATQLPDQVIP